MHIVRFSSPFEQMDSLRRQLDRLFADIEDSPWIPAIELIDEEECLIARMQLPGVARQDIDIQVTRDTVTVTGDRSRPEATSSRCLYTEFDYGQFQRTIALPVPVINTQATANYEAGILILTLPKAEEAKRRVVKINLTDVVSAQKPLAAETVVGNAV